LHAPYFSILLCLMPDNFTRQDERAGAYNVANFVPNFVVKSKVHIEIHKPVCKQSLWLAYFCSGTNQRLCLQTVCEYYYELLNLTKFGTKFATFREKLCEINCNGLNFFYFHAIYNLIYSLPVLLWLGNYRHSFKGFQKLLGGGGGGGGGCHPSVQKCWQLFWHIRFHSTYVSKTWNSPFTDLNLKRRRIFLET
jgi:hypothetical protein